MNKKKHKKTKMVSGNEDRLMIIEEILEKINKMNKESSLIESESDYGYICALDEIEEFLNLLKSNDQTTTKQKTPVMKNGEVETFLIKIDGKPFYCEECHFCNCFHIPDDTRPNWYKCNSCGTLYETEPKKVQNEN